MQSFEGYVAISITLPQLQSPGSSAQLFLASLRSMLTVHQLVNATVSQSVPQNVVTAVRSVTKYFLTDLIAKARQVQSEWIEAGVEQQADSEWPGMVLSRDGPEVQALYDQQATLSEVGTDWSQHILKEEPKGPLRPDHLREAWRRYKGTMQNYGAGTLGLWHMQQQSGAERFPVRTGGKRIFK
jgi:transcription initiation factor TFIID subunit 11